MSQREIFWVLLTSVGLILVFPPFPTGFFAAVVLVPFFFYLNGKGWGKAFLGGYAVGFLWSCGTVYWIGWATVPGLFGVLLILPLYVGLFAILQAWLWNQWGEFSLVAAPFIWTGIEILSSLGVLGFPWNSLAHTQSYYPTLIQYVSVTGVYGVSFWVVLLNVLFYFFLRCGIKWKRAFAFLAMIAILFTLPVVYGRWILLKNRKFKEEVRLALVQGNIDPYKKWTPSFIDSNFTVYRWLTWETRSENPDLMVWPETATPCYLRYRIDYLRQVKSLVDSLGIPLLTGSPDYGWTSRGEIEKYNAALLIHPHSMRIDRYNKMHLVPFSERVPLVDEIPFLYNLSTKLDMDIGDYSLGDSVVVFEFTVPSIQKKVRFSVVICYESVFPYLVRKFVMKGAQFLVVITNDGWFGKTSGPYQHAQIAVFRAIENRIWVARCANTGISEFIDPFGRVQVQTGLYEEAVLGHFLSLNRDATFFLKHGHLILFFVFITDGFILLITFIRGFISIGIHREKVDST